MLVNLADCRLGEGCEVGVGIHHEEITAGGLGKLAQGFRVQLTDDVLAVGVLIQTIFAARIRDGSACCCANANGDDQQIAFLGFLCNLEGGIDGVLTIAQNDQGIGAALRCTALEILHGLAQNEPEIRTAHACPGAVHLLQRIAQGGVVIGERYHQVRLAGKDDKADFITGQGINELVGCGAGFCQAGGFHVLRLHGARYIQRYEEVAPCGRGTAFAVAVDGACQGNNGAYQRQQSQSGGQGGAPEGTLPHQLPVLGGNQPAPALAGAAPCHHHQHNQYRDEQEEPQNVRIEETHGRGIRVRVWGVQSSAQYPESGKGRRRPAARGTIHRS